MLIALHPATPTPNGSMEHASAEWGGQTIAASSKTGAVCALARKLLDAGCPDQTWQAHRDGVPALSGPSLANIAGFVVRETANVPRFCKFKPFDLDLGE